MDLMASANHWNKAILEVEQLMLQNQEFLNIIYQLSSYNQSLNAQQIFEQALKQIDIITESDDNKPSLNFLLTTARTIQKDFGAVDLSEFVEEREPLIANYNYERNNFKNITRSFSDIVFKGPENSAEEVLLISAIAFLPPHDFKKAVTNNLSIAQVTNLIDNSKIKEFTNRVIEASTVQKNEANQEKVDAPMPNILGEKMGVLDTIEQSFNKSNILQDASEIDKPIPLKPSQHYHSR